MQARTQVPTRTNRQINTHKPKSSAEDRRREETRDAGVVQMVSDVQRQNLKRAARPVNLLHGRAMPAVEV